MARPYVELVTEVLPIQRRNFYVSSTSLLNPNNANPILEGEWLELDSTYKLVRGSSTQAKPAWQVFDEKGRYDTQAIGKLTVLFIGGYEAKTRVCDASGCSVGDALVIADVTVGGLTKRGLDKISAVAGEYAVFAYVTKVISSSELQYWVPGTPTWKTVA